MCNLSHSRWKISFWIKCWIRTNPKMWSFWKHRPSMPFQCQLITSQVNLHAVATRLHCSPSFLDLFQPFAFLPSSSIQHKRILRQATFAWHPILCGYCQASWEAFASDTCRMSFGSTSVPSNFGLWLTKTPLRNLPNRMQEFGGQVRFSSVF